MPKIPKIEEWPIGYRTLSIVIMQPQETFTGRTMKQLSIWMRLSMRAKPLDVEPKGWGDNANKIAPTYLQQRIWERTKMNLSTQRHGNMYKSKEIPHVD
jgi:hypothetical protein